MIIQTGIDLVETARIEKSIKNPRFLTRVFSEKELALFDMKSGAGRIQRIAAGFAAKEAFAKAIGTGVRGFFLREVSLLRGSLGAPVLELTGKAAAVAGRSGFSFSVSVTHTEHYASAVVIAYQAEPERTGDL